MRFAIFCLFLLFSAIAADDNELVNDIVFAEADGSSSTTEETLSTTTAVCEDKVDCSTNKKLCTNPAYEVMMHEVCAATCGYCDGTVTGVPCADAIPTCKQWEVKGFCENPFYTDSEKKKDCAKTCGFC